MNCYFEPTNHKEIEFMREDYLKQLIYPMELHIEWLVREGKPHFIINKKEHRVIGYVVILENENTSILVEWHLKEAYCFFSSAIFDTLVGGKNITEIYVLSFDSLAMKCCLLKKFPYKVAGTIFRDHLDTPEIQQQIFSVTVADMSYYSFLLPYEDGLYETTSELAYMLENKMIHLFFKGEMLIACGYCIPVRPDKNWRDIGMWVYTPYRKRGIGTLVIGVMKKLCLENGYRPICGCAYENNASRKALEKNGFYSKHALYLFSVIK